MEALRKNWGWVLAAGALMILLGIAAISLPHIVTWGMIVLVGWLLLIGGGVQLAQVLRLKGVEGRGWAMAQAILRALVGVLFVVNPWAGALTITVMVGLFMLVDGLFRIVIALDMKGTPNRGWILFGGIAALLLGLMIVGGWPGTAAWLIGLFVGISLLCDGWALVMIALAARAGASPAAA